MNQDGPVIVAPDRYDSQCHIWYCTRTSRGLYCTFGHGFHSKTEEEKREAAVYVDSLNIDKETSLSLKILNTKSRVLRCGVPTLSTNVLQGNPSAFPNVFLLNRMDGEAFRNWTFISETVVPPSNVWVRYNTKTVSGMERISWHLRDQPAVGWYRLRRYTLPSYANSLYWLHYDWNKVNKSTTGKTAETKKGPLDPGAGGPSGPSTSGPSTYMSDKGTYGASNASTSGNRAYIGTEPQVIRLSQFIEYPLNQCRFLSFWFLCHLFVLLHWEKIMLQLSLNC